MKIRVLFLICALSAMACPLHIMAAGAPIIQHSPVTVAMQGQELLFRTRVTPGKHPIKAVTLFYAVSRDAAPYKIAMQDSGTGWYTGSIPSDLTTGLNQILYYIEARDTSDTTSETPWQTVMVRNQDSSSAAAKTSMQAPEEKHASWTKPALIAGGVVLAGGAVLALASGGGGGGGGGGSSDGSVTNAAGTYSGTVTQCVQPPDSGSYCSSRALTIFIDNSGTVSSDTLCEGKHLEGKLSGANFLLVASVTETNGTGDIQYLGTVINNRIAGSIQGTLTTSSGTGTYSGNFSAVK